jgi:Mitotic checkpoint regulator, MAD2B-interacting
MALVAYSDSEGSDAEDEPKPTAKATPKPAQTQNASNFALNKSNPRKIQVSLFSTVTASGSQHEDGEPSRKRAKIGGGGLGGFNAMLPAPKRENEKKPTSNGTARKIFSLKTGAEPGFSREADAELRQLFAEQAPTSQPNSPNQSASKGKGIPSETPKVGNPIRFKPLSVSRNTKKRPAVPAQSKKPATSMDRTFSDASAPPPSTNTLVSKSKISLFSAVVDSAPVSALGKSDDMDLEADTGQQDEDTVDTSAIETEYPSEDSLTIASSQPQSLDTIASDLNLSAADRRRLFGREGKGSTSAINVVNFNTDQEYAANEALRSSGEQVQHHAVRGIAPGKHSLKQLVNAATTQKDALEESFAAGKSNKREAGSRYGW